MRGMSFQQVIEEFPNRVGGWRTAGQKVIDTHDLMQGVHLVERQWQFRVIGDATLCQAGLSNIDLLQAGAEIEMIALCRQAAIDRTGRSSR